LSEKPRRREPADEVDKVVQYSGGRHSNSIRDDRESNMWGTAAFGRPAKRSERADHERGEDGFMSS
jgi:hypothetical protein